MKIFKYKLSIGITTLKIPAPAKILSVQTQEGEPMVYAMVDDKKEFVEKKILTVMTGKENDLEGFRFIGTLMLSGGMFVLHAFEKVDK